MRFPVFLAQYKVRDRLGIELTIRERRLVRQSRADHVIAVIEAPAGSRVRRRRDEHGSEQLVVPVGSSPWARLFGPRAAIPAKYVIGSARHGEYGLSIVAQAPAEVPV